MTLPLVMGETVTRLRADTAEDTYRNTVQDWATPDSLDIVGCGVAPGGSFATGDEGRQAISTDFQVYLPTGSDVLDTDRLTIRGVVCEIVGRPASWVNPFTGWAPGMVVSANVREG